MKIISQLTVLAAAVAVVAISAGDSRAECSSCDGGPSHSFYAPACSGPMFGTVPGCCECPPSACDNAWDGFCQEKLYWKSLWYNIGTGVHVHSHYARRGRGDTGRGDTVASYRFMPTRYQGVGQANGMPVESSREESAAGNGPSAQRLPDVKQAPPLEPPPRPEAAPQLPAEPPAAPLQPAVPGPNPSTGQRRLLPITPANTSRGAAPGRTTPYPSPETTPSRRVPSGSRSPHEEGWDQPFSSAW